MTAVRRCCAVSLDGHWFGIEVERVQEVLRPQPITRVPLAPPAIRGLVNLRGQIVTALDVRVVMGLPPLAGEPMHVILRSAGEHVSLLVDRVGDILAVEDHAFEAPPETLTGGARALIRGAYKLPDRLLLLLDIDRLLLGAHPAAA